MTIGSKMAKYVSISIIILCQIFIFSNSYGDNCLKHCEDEYDICTQPLNIFENSHTTDHGHLKDVYLNEYLHHHNILNINESAKVMNNKIYIISSGLNFSDNPIIKKKEEDLQTHCLNKNKICRKKCQR